MCTPQGDSVRFCIHPFVGIAAYDTMRTAPPAAGVLLLHARVARSVSRNRRPGFIARLGARLESTRACSTGAPRSPGRRRSAWALPPGAGTATRRIRTRRATTVAARHARKWRRPCIMLCAPLDRSAWFAAVHTAMRRRPAGRWTFTHAQTSASAFTWSLGRGLERRRS